MTFVLKRKKPMKAPITSKVRTPKSDRKLN